MAEVVSVGGRRIACYAFFGRVVGSRRHAETTVQGFGGGGYSHQGSGHVAPVQISSTTDVYDEFFLADATGRERAFQLRNFTLPFREGSDLSIVWVMREGKKEGPYVCAFNHNTEQMWFYESALKPLVAPSKGALAVLGLLAALLIPALLANLAGFDLSGEEYAPVVMILWFLAIAVPVAWYRRQVQRRVRTLREAVERIARARG
jgi:hypothetical protein